MVSADRKAGSDPKRTIVLPSVGDSHVRDWDDLDVWKAPHDGREQGVPSEVKPVRQELNESELAKRAVPFCGDCIEIRVTSDFREFWHDCVHPVKQSPVVSAGVSDEVE